MVDMLPLYFRSLILLAGLSLGATACAPTYNLALTPAKPTGLFAEGREQALTVADSVEVRLSFVCYEPTRVVFEAEYYNPTSQPLIVDPVGFQYQARRVPAPATMPGRRARRPKPLPGEEVTAAVAAASMALPLPPLPPREVAAYDPEPEISTLRERAQKEAEKAARIDWFGVALSVASVATDMASIGKNETRTQFESRVALQDAALTYNAISTAAKIGHALAADVMQQRAANLQEYALRKVTLQPGHQVRGYLYFPRYDAADALVVKAPVGTGLVPLEFTQKRVRR
ncbi:hypothetical protein [Hymenobacter sp. IS2118]|uniref:hypothetical protein n=1 Tax=Hymenobacter sp. IS2118 TaxID=1505605 RepID=UPI00055574D4|nr:hypothetical protein [Hymenobacter sp. IS2118]